MTRTEIERAALALLREAKLDPAKPINVDLLVRRLLKTHLRAAPMRRGREGVLVRVRDEWRIYLDDSIGTARARWVAAHELAHWDFRRRGIDASERSCDALGAALVAPCPLYLAVRNRTDDVRTIALRMRITQSLAALREGETIGRPIALVESAKVLIRGETWTWPDADEMRLIARVGRADIVRVRIDDEPNRVVLMAA